MTLELTEQQWQMVEGQPGPIEVVGRASAYVLLSREEYEQLRSLQQDEPRPAQRSAAVVPTVSPAMRRAQAAYWRDLPQLLAQKKLHRQWVCFHGEERIGIAKTKTELVQRCLKRGLDDFYVGWIHERHTPPWEPEEIEESLFEVMDEPDSSSPPSVS